MLSYSKINMKPLRVSFYAVSDIHGYYFGRADNENDALDNHPGDLGWADVHPLSLHLTERVSLFISQPFAAMTQQYKYLSPEQVEHFLEHGYIVIKNGFSEEKAEEWTKTMWVRLGLDPNDKTSWTRDRIHMPWHRKERVATFAPKVWDAMQDLLGGADRIDEDDSRWGDSFIVNLGNETLENVTEHIHPKDLDNWHVDGDFFVHYLDSPEQALLVIPIFSNIKPGGGGTYIAPEGIQMIARYLASHPEGVMPTGLSFTPSTTTCTDFKEDPGYWSHLKEVQNCTQFVEMVGEVGDVVLLHPLMLHSAAKNYLRQPRIITNPPVSLKEPFDFARESEDDYSLVEKKTLKALGVDRLDFHITTERRRMTPKRVGVQAQLLAEEKQRSRQRGLPVY
ncbi:hypothetical protein F5878DRAFT_314884 [Lentinula raphanica]|uniref:Clavaminate synthase-like protein n=1 Tax=Lentinula raphanica TaxID=153919 RepID=A0AA38UIM4_9AGAR|nr:hypothetical protein F5878DRAFT_314884 [Lentinula raphanica]